MKIRVYSDCHLDWYFANGTPFNAITGEMHCWKVPVLPDDKDTTLILAGDLWTGTRFIEFAGYSWISEISTRFKNVLIVLGNHDYWPMNNALTIKNGGDTCNALLQDMGIHNATVLDCATWEDDDILFVGATLWTDMNGNNPLAMHNMPNFMRYDGKIAYSTGANGVWERFSSHKWVQEHDRHRKYIELIAKQNPNKKIIVITHHQPLESMGDPSYKGDAANAYYYSDLSNLILDNPNIVMWICGHSHVQMDRMFEHCRLYMNSVGYSSEHFEQEGLVKHEVVEI